MCDGAVEFGLGFACWTDDRIGWPCGYQLRRFTCHKHAFVSLQTYEVDFPLTGAPAVA
jgi:hypothetical protein